LEALVQSIDSRWRVAEVQAVEDIIEGTHVEERSMAAIGVWGTGLALLLMGFGIYGMVGADVAMRQREFAIRAALGSSPLRLLMVVVRSTACVLALGIACGVLVALIVVPSSGAAMVVSSEGVVVACAIALTLGAGVAGVILPLCRVLRMRGDSLLRV
jgi:ABC-type antimicrobial peptide transport system permease subunit